MDNGRTSMSPLELTSTLLPPRLNTKKNLPARGTASCSNHKRHSMSCVSVHQ